MTDTENSRQTPRSRFDPRPQAGLRLEERDRQLLCDLFLHRIMSRGQLQELYFGSVVRCNARLRQLFDHQYVTRYFPPAAPYGAQAIYGIGKRAVPLVASRLEMELPLVGRLARQARTATFIDHTLAIADVWLAFRRAVQQNYPGVEIERWLPELSCRHEYEIRASGGSRHSGGTWHKEVFKPDAFVRLHDKTSGVLSNYFIEVDLGHTSSRQFLRKLQMHQRYQESGLFEEVFGCREFHTLVITTSPRRINNLLALVEEQQSDLFWFATFDEIEREGILGSIWEVPLDAHRRPLGISCR